MFLDLEYFVVLGYILSEGQIKLWGHRGSFFCYHAKCVKNLYFYVWKRDKIINFVFLKKIPSFCEKQ